MPAQAPADPPSPRPLVRRRRDCEVARATSPQISTSLAPMVCKVCKMKAGIVKTCNGKCRQASAWAAYSFKGPWPTPCSTHLGPAGMYRKPRVSCPSAGTLLRGAPDPPTRLTMTTSRLRPARSSGSPTDARIPSPPSLLSPALLPLPDVNLTGMTPSEKARHSQTRTEDRHQHADGQTDAHVVFESARTKEDVSLLRRAPCSGDVERV